MTTMERCRAAFAIALSLFAATAQANDALETKVRAYVPVISLVKFCDITINDAILGEHSAILAAANPTRTPRNSPSASLTKRRRPTSRPEKEVNGSPSARTSSQPTANTPRRASPPWSRTT